MTQQQSAPPPEDLVASSGVELVHLRNDFYRDSYQKIVKLLLVSVLIIVMLSGLLSYLLLNPTKPQYFAVDTNGRITPIIPLNQPNVSPAALLQWATQAVVASYSYNFVNYRQELQAASEFFTPSGWSAFLSALQDAGNLKSIKEKKLVTTAVVVGAPVIIQQGTESTGRYMWRVQLPLLVTYQSASVLSQQHLVITMKIVRIDTVYSARGLGIDQFVADDSGYKE